MRALSVIAASAGPIMVIPLRQERPEAAWSPSGVSGNSRGLPSPRMTTACQSGRPLREGECKLRKPCLGFARVSV